MSSTMSMSPIDEEGNDKDVMETDTQMKITEKLGYSDLAKSLDGSLAVRSMSNSRDSDGCLDVTWSPTSPFTKMMTNIGKALAVSSSGKHLTGSNQSLRGSCSSKSLGFSGSARLFPVPKNQKKMYVKQVTGKHNDTELHLAAMRGDMEVVRQILEEIEAQVNTTAGSEAELAEIQTAIVNEVNELGETPLFVAADKGHLEVVTALLPHMTRQGIAAKNRSGLDALHVAVTQAHADIVQVLLGYDRGLCHTFGQSNATPLISAATRGHTAIVRILLENDSSLINFSKNNGKNALHFSVRQGHLDITEALLSKDPQLARKTDKKGQTALHMAVKGSSCEVVKLLLRVDPSTVMLPDRLGNMALHIATRKKRVEVIRRLTCRSCNRRSSRSCYSSRELMSMLYLDPTKLHLTLLMIWLSPKKLQKLRTHWYNVVLLEQVS